MTTLVVLAEHPRGIAAAIVVLWIGVYLAACAWWPFRAHSRCSGTGKLRSPSGRSWRRCPGCGGTGTKLRIGRRLWGAAVSTSRKRP